MNRLCVVVFVAFLGVGLCCVEPDCDTPDCGSCGQACCLINFMFKAKAKDVMNMVVSNLKKGGDDMRYTFVNVTDYTKENFSSGVVYQLQAIHRTKVYHYNDTLDMIIISKDMMAMDTTIRGFSISRIEGAYCDDGQNYKNLVGFVKGLGVQFKQEIVFGCTKNPF